jgi:hypothetical protein
VSVSLLIGIGGKAQTGKGTVARMIRDLARLEGHIASPLAYAWPMKARVAALNHYTEEELLTKPDHVRTAYQIEGTEKGRDVYGDNFWVDHLKYMLALMSDEEPRLSVVTIPDARFPNELDYIRAQHGYTIWIESDRGTLANVQAQHRSETSVDQSMFDVVFTNNRDTTLVSLQARVAAWWSTGV